jgi:type I restriction enzyme, R subunit
MSDKEATARIKINKLLEAAGWRFFAADGLPANIRLEPSVTIKTTDIDALGNDFEKTAKGYIDFLLLDAKSFPLIVLEAKAEGKDPLAGKEQARRYARSQNCRFVILSNGNLHYFWDLERGSPFVITTFPTPSSVTGYQKTMPAPGRLVDETVGGDYVVLTQRPGYAAEAAWKNEAERSRFIATNSLRFLRPYQKKAVCAIQQAILSRTSGAPHFQVASFARPHLMKTPSEVKPVSAPAAARKVLQSAGKPLHYQEHHRARTFQEEYRAFLVKYGVVFDERYVWD